MSGHDSLQRGKRGGILLKITITINYTYPPKKRILSLLYIDVFLNKPLSEPSSILIVLKSLSSIPAQYVKM